MTLLTLGRRLQQGSPPVPVSLASMLADVGTPASLVETDLANLVIPPSIWERPGASVKFWAHLRTAANANTKRLRILYGATQIFDSTALAANAEQWLIEGLITRRAAINAQEIVIWGVRGATPFTPNRVAGTVDMALAGSTLRFAGTNGTAAANELVLAQLVVERKA